MLRGVSNAIVLGSFGVATVVISDAPDGWPRICWAVLWAVLCVTVLRRMREGR